MSVDYYPGTRRKIENNPPPPVPDRLAWDAKPRIFVVGGKDVELFTVGQLAQALGREAGTIRKWESNGILPKAMYSSPSDDPRGKRRLYTRAMVEGIVKIAKQEGILAYNSRKSIAATRFTSRVVQLFKESGVTS